jgi:hypothetical protein
MPGISLTSGAIGPKGDIGPTGPSGGFPGPAGSQGAQGSPGVQGSQGSPGAQGSQGSPGTPGEPGPVGLAGPTGAQGSPGRDGLDQGVQGSPGVQGPQGLAGNQGPQGSQGHVGNLGPTGPSGIGLLGLTGPQGPRGESIVGATPDYAPPSIIYKSSLSFLLPIGRYYLGGYRVRNQYQDLINITRYVDLETALEVNTDSSYTGNDSIGIIGGAKVLGSWFSVFLTSSAGVVVLPFVRVKSSEFRSQLTEVILGDHYSASVASERFILENDIWKGYTLVKISNDETSGNTYQIVFSSSSNPNTIYLNNNVSQTFTPGGWFQLVPPVPSVYLGAIYIDNTGSIQRFTKVGWITYWSVPEQINQGVSPTASIVFVDKSSPVLSSMLSIIETSGTYLSGYIE